MGKSTMPPEFAGLPAVLLADVDVRCQGDWRRVVLNRDGSLTVRNKPTNKVSSGPKPKPRSAPDEKGPETTPPDVAPAPGPAVVWKRVTLPPALPPQRRAGPAKAPGAVKPQQLPREPESPERHHSAWDELPAFDTTDDWEGTDAGRVAFGLATLAKGGLPTWIKPSVHEDVLALAGTDWDAMDASVRNPARVEVAEETASKHYPVLRFYLGSVCTVIGFRNPRRPKVIACYFTGEALKAYQGRSGAGAGGGGARKEEGLPKNGPALIRRLRGLGAECAPLASDSLKCLHKVTFKGHDLGQVPGDTITPKAEIETHFQRTQRRIAAIKQRMESQSA